MTPPSSSRLGALVLAVVLALSLTACGDDGTSPALLWDLTVVNATAEAYDIYQATNLSTLNFQQIGVVGAASTAVVEDLTVNTAYTFCLVPEGNPLSDCDFQQEFMSSGADLTWSVP